MAKKHIKKQTQVKDSQTKKPSFSEKRQRHYAFGFLIGEY
jgi:hypothetical protein